MDWAANGDVSYGDEPAVLVFADSTAARAHAEAAVRAAGGRIAATLSIAEAIARLDRQAVLDGIIVEIETDSGPALDRLLDRIEMLGRTRGCASVVAMPAALIDTVSARIGNGVVQLLCAPDPIERTAALGAIMARGRVRLHDVTNDGEARRLHKLGEEVGRIARTLAALSAEVLERDARGAVGDRSLGYRSEPGAPAPIDAETIRAMIRARRLRDRFFAQDLFADPAWDMLLDLMAARIERAEVAVSSLCIAAAVPPTTALRWIRTMTDQGLLERRADPVDGRRVFIALSDQAAAGMTHYFAALRQTGGIMV